MFVRLSDRLQPEFEEIRPSLFLVFEENVFHFVGLKKQFRSFLARRLFQTRKRKWMFEVP